MFGDTLSDCMARVNDDQLVARVSGSDQLERLWYRHSHRGTPSRSPVITIVGMDRPPV